MKSVRNDLLTIPNLLSLLRLLMIPVFVYLYLNGHPEATAYVLLLSGLTDVIDGWVARTFNQVSDFGKAFDPVADKLTQAAMLLCLFTRFPKMIWIFVLMAIKELFAGISGLIVIKRTGIVQSAQWHGKVTTMLLYGMMIVHLIWQEIPLWASNILTAACVAMMALSMVLYGIRNIRLIRSAAEKADDAAKLKGDEP